jgi:hypothetical protein
MSVLNESAVEVFERLAHEARGKERVSLERIKTVCDEIVTARGVMNYARVGDLATQRFGGPRPQSILNSKRLKLYISARISNYEAKSLRRDRGVRPVGDQQKTRSGLRYPASDLDPRTRIFIDRLHTEIEFLQRICEETQKLLERETQQNPPALAEIIASGPDEHANLQLSLPGTPSVTPKVARALLRLCGRDPQFGVVTHLEVNVEPLALICTDHGVRKAVWDPSVWNLLVDWAEQEARGTEGLPAAERRG